MKKIPSLFKRNMDGDHLVRNEVTPGAEWVINGEGIATRKWDGTACLVQGGKLFRRYDAKAFTIKDGARQEWGRKPPEGFAPAQESDPNTGHWPGWLPITDSPQDQWHREAFTGMEADGTYELCGPKLQGNPEGLTEHDLIPHGKHEVDAPRTFDELREWLKGITFEGVVWHHPDGRMVKIKRSDFWRKGAGLRSVASEHTEPTAHGHESPSGTTKEKQP